MSNKSYRIPLIALALFTALFFGSLQVSTAIAVYADAPAGANTNIPKSSSSTDSSATTTPKDSSSSAPSEQPQISAQSDADKATADTTADSAADTASSLDSNLIIGIAIAAVVVIVIAAFTLANRRNQKRDLSVNRGEIVPEPEYLGKHSQ